MFSVENGIRKRGETHKIIKLPNLNTIRFLKFKVSSGEAGNKIFFLKVRVLPAPKILIHCFKNT